MNSIALGLMMGNKYSHNDLANVQNYLMLKGHACPTFYKDKVYYLERTPGSIRMKVSKPIQEVLDIIWNLPTLAEKEALLQFKVSNPNRIGIGGYQIALLEGRLMCMEELPIDLRGQFD